MRLLSIFCAVLMLQMFPAVALANPDPSATPPPSPGMDLNLGSTVQSIPAANLGSVIINVGGQPVSVDANSTLTPAQYVAAMQVLQTGAQNLQLGAAGQAVGGRFMLPPGTNSVNNLVVPQGVNLLQSVGNGAPLNFTGDITNAGSVLLYSHVANTTAVLNAANIHNQTSGVISTSLSTAGFESIMHTNPIANLSLALNATGNIVNKGRINSAGNLSVSAGGSISNLTNASSGAAPAVMQAAQHLNMISPNVINSAMLTAQTGNINFNTAGAALEHIKIANTGGTIQALHGDINVRESGYADKGDITITGGLAQANNINLEAGCGAVNVNMEQIDGTVNSVAGIAHVTAHGGALQVGDMTISGDPTFYNTNGDVTISGIITTNGSALAFVASRNITSSANAEIDTSGAANGGELTIVAGAQFTTDDLSTSGSNNSSTTLTLTGGSPHGGNINLNNVNVIKTSGAGAAGDAGDIHMIAYSNTASQPGSGGIGSITVRNATTIEAKGSGTGANGDVKIIAGGAATSLGTIDTAGGTGGGGNVLIANAQPVIVSPSSIVIFDGAIQPGSGTWIPNGTWATGGITVDTITTGDGSLTMGTANSIAITGPVNLGSGALTATVTGGSQNINFNQADADVTAGSVNLSARNGSVILRDVTTTDNITVYAPSVTSDAIVVTGTGNVDISFNGVCCSTVNFGSISTQSGYIKVDLPSSIVAGPVTTAGGSVVLDSDTNVTAQYVIAANGGNYGNVTIRGDVVNISGSLSSQFGSEAAPTNNSLVGHSVLITTQSGEIKLLSDAGVPWILAGLNLTIAGQSVANNPVELHTQTGATPLTVLPVVSSDDFVAVANRQVNLTGAPTLDRSDPTGLGGQVLIAAGKNFDLDGSNWIRIGANSATSILNAGADIVTNNGAAVYLIASDDIVGNLVTASEQGLISMTASNDVQISGAIANGTAGTNENGGTIIINADSISNPGITTLLLAQGANGGNGGTITLNLIAQNVSLAVGSAAGEVTIDASNGGGGTGNGGNISLNVDYLTAGGSLTIDSSSLLVGTPVTGKGGTISILVNDGSASLTGPGLAAGSFDNDAGSISINVDDGQLALLAPLSASSTNSGNGGSIFVRTNGTPTFANLITTAPVTLAAAGGALTGNGGSITVDVRALNLGGTMTVDADAGGYGSGGSIDVITRDNIGTPDITIGNGVGGITLSATGGSAGSNAGDGGTIDIQSALSLTVDVEYLNVDALGDYGDGGNINLEANQGLFPTGQISILSSGARMLQANAAARGNGGSIGVFNNHEEAPATQITTDVTADGGTTFGGGGTIALGSLVSNQGLLTNIENSDIQFTGGVTVSASATKGVGGTLRVAANTFTFTGGTPVFINVNGSSDQSQAQGGTLGHGGSIFMATRAADADINISDAANSFRVQATGASSGSATANGGLFQAWTAGTGDFDVDVAFLDVTPSGTSGSGGAVTLEAMPGGANYTSVGGIQPDRLGGGITVRSSTAAILDVSGTTPEGGGSVQIYSISAKPISISTSISVEKGVAITNQIFVSNIGPGGVEISGGLTFNADNVGTSGPGEINISTSHLNITGTGPLTLTAAGPVSSIGGGTIGVTTTDPGLAGSLEIGSGDGQLLVRNHATGETTNFGEVVINAGGNLTVDVGALEFGNGELWLSAGVVPETFGYPYLSGGPPVYGRSFPNNPIFADRQGNLSINGPLNGDGGPTEHGARITLVSNSSTPFTINGGIGTNGILGTISATGSSSGGFMGSIIVANLGGDIEINNPGDLQITNFLSPGGADAAGSPPAPLNLPNANGTRGIIELYAPNGNLEIGSGTFNAHGNMAAQAGNTSRGGYVYLNAREINLTSGTVFLDVSSNFGSAGAVAVIATNDDITIDSSNIVIDARGNIGGHTSFQSPGNVTVIAGNGLTVNTTSLLATASGSTGSNGPALVLGSRGSGAVSINNTLTANGTGAGAAGSIELILGSDQPFLFGGGGVNGINGTLVANNGAGSNSGNIKFTMTSGDDQIIDVSSQITQLGTGTITFNATEIGANGPQGELIVNLQGSGLLQGPISATTADSVSFNFLNNSSPTFDDVVSLNGNVDLITDGSTLTLLASGTAIARQGNVSIINTNANGAISIGANSLISASGDGNQDVLIQAGGSPLSGGGTPANITVHTFGTGTVSFAPAGVTATGPVSVFGENNDVLIGGTATAGVTIAGGTRIQSVQLNSLDLTDAAVVTYLQNLQTQGILTGTLTPAGGPATGGDLNIPLTISTNNLSALNIPNGVTVRLRDLTDNTPVTVTTSSQVLINGSLRLQTTTANPSDFTLNVLSSQSTPAQDLFALTGTVINESANGDLTISSQGDITMTGTAASVQTRRFNLGGTLTLQVGTGSDLTISSTTGLGPVVGGIVRLIGEDGIMVFGTSAIRPSRSMFISNGGQVGTAPSPVQIFLDDPVFYSFSLGGQVGTAFIHVDTTNNSGDSYSPTYLNGIQATNLTITTVGSIGQGSGVADVTGALDLGTTNGFIGTEGNPLRVSSQGSITAVATGDVKGIGISNESNTLFNVINLTATDAIALQAVNSMTVSNVFTTQGDILIQGAATLGILSAVTTLDGNITIQNTDTGGTITFAANSLVLANDTDTAPTVSVFIGPGPAALVPGSTPANVAEIGSGSIFYNNGITANTPTNTVYVNGAGSRVIFDTGALPANNILLQGNTRIIANNTAVPSLTVSSLDLTDPATVTAITNLQSIGLVGGTLVVDGGGIATGGDLILTPINIQPNMTALNVPLGVSTVFQSFFNPISFLIDDASTTTIATVNGSVVFTNSPSNVMIVTAIALNPNAITTGNSAQVSAPTGNLTIAGTKPFINNGTINVPNGLLTLNDLANGGNITAQTLEVIQSFNNSGSVTVTGNSMTSNASSFGNSGNITVTNGDLILTDTQAFLNTGDISAQNFDATFGIVIGGTFTNDTTGNLLTTEDLNIHVMDGTVLSNGTMSSGGNLTITASTFDAGGASALTSGSSVLIKSDVGLPLTLTGDGDIAGNAFNAISTAGALTVDNAAFTFRTTAYLYSSTAIVINANSDINGDSVIQINSPLLTLSGTVDANQLVFNKSDGTGLGTIINPTGDVRLPANLVFAGSSLAIMASGNILTAKPSVTSIKLSSTTGNGGSLTMIAGYDFVLAGTTTVPTASNTPVPGTNYEITGPSATGGSILLPTVNIDTSSTSKDANNNDAGLVLGVAKAGTTNAGIISLGSITAKADKVGTGGFIHLIGEGGIQTKNIVNTGGSGNAVILSARAPQILGGPVIITNGISQGPGVFYGGDPSSAIFGGVTAGSITTNALVGSGGSVTIFGDGGVTVTGAIKTTGLSSASGGAAGGPVVIESLVGAVKTLGIDTSAVKITSTTSSANGGNGGGIEIMAAAGITVTGNLIAAGASTSGTGNGGNASAVTLSTSQYTDLVGLFRGNTRITGTINAGGGDAKAGTGGAGALVTINSGTVQVAGSGTSIKASGGVATGGAGSNGAVNITTNDTQPLTTIFDLTTKTKNIAVLPGSVFTVGTANPVNGVSGSILVNPLLGPVNKSNVGPLGLISAPAVFSLNGVAINLVGTTGIDVAQGANPDIHFDALVPGTAKRTLLTPSQAMAVYQEQHAQTPFLLDANGVATAAGGTIQFDQSDISGPFTAFKLPSAVTVNVTGLAPVLQLKSGIVLNGDVVFPTATTAMVDFGTASPNIPATASITAPNLLIISTNGSSFTLTGTIAADQLIVGRTGTSAITLNEVGTGDLQLANGLVLSQTTSPSLAMNVRAKGSNWDTEVRLATVPLSTRFDALGSTYAKNANKLAPVTLTFALFDGGNNALDADIISQGGNYGKMSISTIATKSGTVSINTPLIAFLPFVNSDSTVSLSAVGDLTFGADSGMSAAKGLTITSKQNVQILEGTYTAGVLNPADPGTGVVLSTNVTSIGALTVKGASVNLGNSVTMNSTGANITVTALTGDVDLGNTNTLQANGGRLLVFGKDDVVDGGGNVYRARSTSVASNPGGGIEFGAGLTASSNLSTAFGKPAGVVGGFNPTGITIGAINGVFMAKVSGGGTINLAGPPASTLNFNRGAMVFDAIGSTSTVDIQNASFFTDALKPISATTIGAESDAELVIESGADEEYLD